MPVCLLQSLQLLFLDKRDGFANKDEKLYKAIIRKVLTAINGMPHQLFAGGIKARYIYLELKMFTGSTQIATLEVCLMTKFELWTDFWSSTDNGCYSSGKTVAKSEVIVQSEKLMKAVIMISYAKFSVWRCRYLSIRYSSSIENQQSVEL